MDNKNAQHTLHNSTKKEFFFITALKVLFLLYMLYEKQLYFKYIVFFLDKFML